MKKVLIAHQSTIPHYRIDFYNTLHRIKPDDWDFDVVYDTSEKEKNRFFSEEVKPESFNFKYLDTNTYTTRFFGYDITIQDFIRFLNRYDVVVVEHAFNNLSYPFSLIVRLWGKSYALWGHGKHLSVINPTGIKWITENLKKKQVKLSDLYFAYTDSVKDYLVGEGIQRQKVVSLNNTIDINKQRSFYKKYLPSREKIRGSKGLSDKRVLLFVGRINENKKVPVIVESFKELLRDSLRYHLVVVGDGDKSLFKTIPKESRILFDAITDSESLAPYYVASDLFIFPGLVGLGPLQAMCYSLPVITIDSERHMPEFSYLNDDNSFILPAKSTPKDFAGEIKKLFKKDDLKKDKVWESISHLTIENMAYRFIQGINTLLN